MMILSTLITYSQTTLYAQTTLPQKYKIEGQCFGLPKVKILTAPGFCLGLIDQGDNLLMPRTSVELESGDLIITDLGGWDALRGKIYYYEKNNNDQYTKNILFQKKNTPQSLQGVIDRPHHIIKGPDGLVYIAGSTSVLSFNALAFQNDGKPFSKAAQYLKVVLSNLPSEGLHSLKSLSLINQDLFVTIGSSSNVCVKDSSSFNKNATCKSEVEGPEPKLAHIRKYKQNADGTFTNYQIYAKGLRNVIGFYYDESFDILWGIDNGRDQIDDKNKSLSDSLLPHDELNIIQENKHYGWPYCYDQNLNNPEWKNFSCKQFEKPFHFLPPHSAPLSLLRYTGENFPQWYYNKMIISYHGYRETGNRIVVFDIDDNGLPIGIGLSLVYQWKTLGGKLGSPVGITQLQDGSLLIIEDKNRTIMKLMFDPSLKLSGDPIDESKMVDRNDHQSKSDAENTPEKIQALKKQLENDLKNPKNTFAKIQHHLIDRFCVSCHGPATHIGFRLHDTSYNEKIFLKDDLYREIFSRVSDDGTFKAMPYGGFPNTQDKIHNVQLLKDWIKSIGR